MNRPENLESDLAIWFADTAAPRVPDFIDDILNATAGTNQRPRWSFPERWLPMSVITLGRQTFKPLPWRTIGLLAALAILIAAMFAFYIGSQPRLPAPFGRAANGQVAYASGGDIYVVDPTTGTRRAITTGPNTDAEPRWSLDGTRLAFLRVERASQTLVIADARSGEITATTDPLDVVDSDSMAWAPDGRSVAIGAERGGSRVLYIVDASDGSMKPLSIDYAELDVYWRPPDGRQLMFFGGRGANIGLFLLDIESGKVSDIARPAVPGGVLRPAGWTPDGRRVVYMRGDPVREIVDTYIVDLTTRETVVIEDARAPHVSNDGTRIVAINEMGRMCVADTRVAGPCVVVGRPDQAYGPSHAGGVQWSPDDKWIITRQPDDTRASLVDPNGVATEQPTWISDGAVSWQRVAP
jgi:Tol biopolymer transport system component